MPDEMKIIERIESIVKGFPGLTVLRSEEGVEIRYTGGSGTVESEALVGNYTFDAVARGEITDSDVREDCLAFLLLLTPRVK